MTLDDSVRNMQLQALNLPKKPIALDNPSDYAKQGGRASSLPIKDLPLYQLAWDRGGWSVAVETDFRGDNLYAILREEIPSNDSDSSIQLAQRVVGVSVPHPEDQYELPEAMHQLANKLHDAYRAEFGSELALKKEETEGLIITDLLLLKGLRVDFSKN